MVEWRLAGLASALVLAAVACSTPDAQGDGTEPDSSVAGAATASEAGARSGPDCPVDLAPTGSAVFEGDVVVHSAQDLAAIANVSEITGSLRVMSLSEALELPNLERLGGDLEADSSNVTLLRLPNLQQIGGKLWIYLSARLIELRLPALESIGGEIFIMRNLALTTVRLDRLTDVGGGIVFQAQTSLPACATDPYPVLDPTDLKNGGADMRCWCESPCGFPVARCAAP